MEVLNHILHSEVELLPLVVGHHIQLVDHVDRSWGFARNHFLEVGIFLQVEVNLVNFYSFNLHNSF